MTQLKAVLSDYETKQIETMLVRIKAVRPEQNGPQRQLHYAVEEALKAIASLGAGVTSTALSFEEVGRDVRNIVEGRDG